jgi:hypothetical protein
VKRRKTNVFIFKHASAEVERMLIGNKCDMQDKRQVSREKGEHVCNTKLFERKYIFLFSLLRNMELNLRRPVLKEIL